METALEIAAVTRASAAQNVMETVEEIANVTIKAAAPTVMEIA